MIGGDVMRTLLIDNYDSFTYNLYHLIASVNGCQPLVVTNDADWSSIQLSEIDNIIISPGPGRPDRARDFGISADAIRSSGLPVLGVCLGHQGICEIWGATVGLAPEPRHGRKSPVYHNGGELFAGIPSPFSAVRYHSLAVSGVPSELECTAWSGDGVVMAVRHRDFPLWGVQFHPESICTEYGAELLANFRELSAVYRQPRCAVSAAGSDRAGRPGGAAPLSPPRYRLHARRLPSMPDPEQVYLTFFARKESSFWLDSGPGSSGRLSFMGDGEGPLAEVVTYDIRSGVVRIRRADGSEETVRESVFRYLESRLRERRLAAPGELPSEFNLGYVGYLGYELKAETGGDVAHTSESPDAAFIFADRMIIFDAADGSGWLVCLSHVDAGPAGSSAAAEGWLEEFTDRMAELEKIDAKPPHLDDLPLAGPPDIARFRHEQPAYIERIKSSLQEIHQGESYEVCLTNMAAVPLRGDAATVYRRLRRISPVPYGALLRLPSVAVLSSSPERFISVSADGAVESRPIKGTRPRGATEDEDERLRRDLLHHEKDKAENLMIVDLVRNDLGRVCDVGSVHVPRIFEIETYRTVHQLVSTVRGQLRADASAIECVRAAFPGGSMTGAPKVRTMQIIDSLEEGARGVYSGALGWFGLSGAADLSIVIRTVVVSGDTASFGTGGAIVALSDPADEYEEILVKSRAMLAALGAELPAQELLPGASR
jgi:para-aminobenzoate synthetase